MKIDKSRLNVAQIFLVYMTLVGDVEKTALALDLDPALVSELAKEEGWSEKIKRCSMMSKGDNPGDWERAQNRALNFVQAHRVRLFVDRMIAHLEQTDVKEFFDTDREVNGRLVKGAPNVKFVTELSAALEKVHSLSYHALGDTLGERKDRSSETEVTAASLHTALIAALSSQDLSGQESDLLVREVAQTIESAQQLPPAAPDQTAP